MIKILLLVCLSFISSSLYAEEIIKSNYDLGSDAYNNGDFLKAFEYFNDSAQKEKDARAQFALGLMYFNGRGIPRDDNKALEWFTKSAEQNNQGAMFIIARMYIEGNGVERDPKKESPYIKKPLKKVSLFSSICSLMLCSMVPMFLWIMKRQYIGLKKLHKKDPQRLYIS